MPLVLLIFKVIVAVLTDMLRKEKNVKYEYWKGKVKFSLFSDDMLVSVENSIQSTNKKM